MPPKGISSITLNLRFMQNAARAQEDTNVAAEARPSTSATAASSVVPQDESQWEIAGSAKEGWGASTSSISKPQATAVHEQSYLPFIFGEGGSSGATSNSKVRGRRQWNKRGQEVVEDTQPVIVEEVKPSVSLSKLSSISGPAGGGGYVAPVRKDEKKGKNTLAPVKLGRTAQQAVSQSGGVGTDLRRSKPGTTTAPKASLAASEPTAMFLKPAGVDLPSVKSEPAGDTSDPKDSVQSSKRTRENQGSAEPRHKRKKKKATVKSEE